MAFPEVRIVGRMTVIPSPAAVIENLGRIRPYVRRTPVVELLDDELGPSPVVCKLEQLQHTGSFKPRGAFTNLLRREVPDAGVVAASGGNHGAAVAYAARTLGHTAHVFVPEVSAPAKVELIRSLGAEVHVGGPTYAEALQASEAWIADTGALPVHAYDSVETLLGQGSVGVELLEQVPDLDTVLVAVGGGGLIGGIAAALTDRVRVVAVEPEGCPTLHDARRAGRPVDVTVGGVAVDSLGARRLGEHVWPLVDAYVDHAVLVGDDVITHARSWAWSRTRQLLEPGGATALAALLSGGYQPAEDERVAVVLCGANTGSLPD